MSTRQTGPPSRNMDDPCTGNQVTLSSGGGHVAGSPFPLRVSPGQAYAGASVCDDCEAVFLTPGNFSVDSTKQLRLSTRCGNRNTTFSFRVEERTWTVENWCLFFVYRAALRAVSGSD